MKNFDIIVDGDHHTTYYDFIADNTEKDVTPLVEEDIKALRELQPGETVPIGMVEVSRPKKYYVKRSDGRIVPVSIPAN